MSEMIGELFLPTDMPEPPKESFFKGLFGGGARNLDREELCKLEFYYFMALKLSLAIRNGCNKQNFCVRFLGSWRNEW